MNELPLDPTLSATLVEVLEQSRELGFLGPGPVEAHLRHALDFVPVLAGVDRALDLGSGGGVPGLVLALALPATSFTLVDSSARRCRFLERSVDRFDLSEKHVTVECGRAEDLARHIDLRGRFDAVVARSFGPPAVTAECAVAFLRGPSARVLVSEPPDAGPERWPRDGLAKLGLVLGDRIRGAEATIQILEAESAADDRFPRRNGIPAKRPIF